MVLGEQVKRMIIAEMEGVRHSNIGLYRNLLDKVDYDVFTNLVKGIWDNTEFNNNTNLVIHGTGRKY